MLITIALHQPEMLATVVARTPTWVWGLLAALVAVGASQLRDRTAGLARTALVPVGMTVFSAWGMAGAFGASPLFGQVIAVWLGVAVAVTAALAPGLPAGAYDPEQRQYRLPGSVVPLLLIAGIFMVKWCVGVEMAIQPQLVRDATFALPVAAVYGVFNGLFAGRAARLLRLALRPVPAALAA